MDVRDRHKGELAQHPIRPRSDSQEGRTNRTSATGRNRRRFPQHDSAGTTPLAAVQGHVSTVRGRAWQNRGQGTRKMWGQWRNHN